jgi:Tfp pilus assembly protein PilF
MRTIVAFFILALALVLPAMAETVEVAPGVRVTKKTYSVPSNEQPFFGFVIKTQAQIAADEKLTSEIAQLSVSRERILSETLKRGWAALTSGDLVTAGRRFNQAYLLNPSESGIYHAFAALVQTRFNDREYADELFQVALKQPHPAETLRADYGRFLMIVKRPVEARPVLEQAVIDAPKFGNAWSNLAFARLQTGDQPGACTAAAQAEKLVNFDNVKSDLALLKREAHC